LRSPWCPNCFNPDQADADGDGIGDACEAPPVGGTRILVDEPNSLAAYIASVSTILVATVAAGVCVKRVKRREKK